MDDARNDAWYVTASIPYVNAQPHVGHALELVQADVVARHARRHGRPARLLNGTDDNAAKNVEAAAAAGRSVTEHVAANAAEFHDLVALLDLSVDDFLSTSSDPRHRPGVEALWQACAERGDLYKSEYQGLYCTGCEQFFTPDELDDGRCRDHDRQAEVVWETNWFFRLSRYTDQLRDLVATSRLRIEPSQRRNQVLAALDAGLGDVSVSRDASRCHGWGIPVPGDPTQVVYVWWDALCNYVTALGAGSDSSQLSYWWQHSQRRVHVVGKGILHFHALYWPALLLSAGLEVPTDVFVHEYLTVEGHKISKTLGNVVHPRDVVAHVGPDAFRWWCVSQVARLGDTDYRTTQLTQAWNHSIAGGVGNLHARVAKLVATHRSDGLATHDEQFPAGDELSTLTAALAGEVAAAVDRFDLRRAAVALDEVVAAGNRLLATTEPWKLARQADPQAQRHFDQVCRTVLDALAAVGRELETLVPRAGRLLLDALDDGRLGPLFTPLG